MVPVREPGESPPARAVRWTAGTALAAVGISVALMVVIGAEGPSAAVPRLRPATPWPPYFAQPNASPTVMSALTWAATLIGGAGLAAGLLAVRRGWRPRSRPLIAGSVVAVVALMVVPPVGSTDMLDYAAYGRIAALGHSPYVMTPARLKRSGDPVGAAAPQVWENSPSAYGPLATVTEQAASDLAGDSAARTVFWLKVWNALAFLVVVVALDRLLRADAARRARAHLLWTVNPLMLLAVMAGGHVDGLAAGAGVTGLLAFRRCDVRSGLVAGVLVGAAVAIKAPFALFGAGLAWAACRSPRSPRTLAALAALGAGAAAVIGPSYALAGQRALLAVARRSAGSTDLYEPWQLLNRVIPWSHASIRIDEIALVASLLLAVILLWRLPAEPSGPPGPPGPPAGTPGLAAGAPGPPAVRPALALSLAWLVCSPQQRPWFDVMVFPLLAVMPATRLDWIALLQAVAAAAAELPGVTYYTHLRPFALDLTADAVSRGVVPVTLAVAASGLLWLCLSGRWTPGPSRAGPGPGRPLSDVAPAGQQT